MRFIKLYAAGRDIICIDNVTQTQPHIIRSLSRPMCNRHCGAGADGVLVLERSPRADARLRLYLPNGEEGVPDAICQCGAASFAAGAGIARQRLFRMEAADQIVYATQESRKGRVARVRLDSGPPVLQADRIPTTLPGNPPVEVPVTFPDTMHNVTAVAMTAPYAVIFARELTDALIQGVGRQLETHPGFPQRTSVAFAKVNRRDDVAVRVWERYAGEVTASGAAAAAVAIAGALTGRCQRRVAAHLPGGDFEVDWERGDNHVYLTCAVTEVYHGDWPDRNQ
jgi:diaminopimelate epimerase